MLRLLGFVKGNVVGEAGPMSTQFIDPGSTYYDPSANGLSNYQASTAAAVAAAERAVDEALALQSTMTAAASAMDEANATALADAELELLIGFLNGQAAGDILDVTVPPPDPHFTRVNVADEVPGSIVDFDLVVTYSTTPGTLFTAGDGRESAGLVGTGFEGPGFAVVTIESTFSGGANARIVIFEKLVLPRVEAQVGNRTAPVTNFERARVSNVPSPANTPLKGRVRYKGKKKKHLGAVTDYMAGNQGAETSTDNAVLFPPPVFPETISLSLSASIVTTASPEQATVTGLMDDGSMLDLSTFADGTAYASSNTNVAVVDYVNGMISFPGASGVVAITASNEGTSATAKLIVSLGDPLTTVEGFVHFDDGSAASGASVRLTLTGATTTTDSNGLYSFASVPTQIGPTRVTATADVGPDSYFGGDGRSRLGARRG